MYQRILVTSDLSAEGSQLVKFACGLAQLHNAALYFIHVLECSPLTYADDFSIPLDPHLETGLMSQAEAITRQLVERFHLNADHTRVAQGSVRHAVIEYANEINADLIVVGSHSLNAIDRLLGSRANAILHHATCDVWVYKFTGESA